MKRRTSTAALTVAILLPLLSAAASAQTELPQIESFAAPAVAQLNGTTYIAFAGFHSHPEGYHLLYTTLGGSQTSFDFYTRTPPALATALGTVYLAARGNAATGTDSIYYSSLQNGKLPAPAPTIPLAQTTAAPALAGDSSALFAAWTSATGAIQYASYTGSWSAPHATPGVTETGRHPALAVFNGSLYLAWIEPKTDAILYASLSLSSGSWSAATPVGSGAVSGAPPSLAVYNGTITTSAGLYIGWVTNGDLNAWKYDTEASTFIPGPIPPGPLATNFAPALLSSSVACAPGLLGGLSEFDVFYTSGSDGNIYQKDLLTSGECKAPPRGCHPNCQ